MSAKSHSFQKRKERVRIKLKKLATEIDFLFLNQASIYMRK